MDKIKEVEDNSIDCVVTSPPYWGLRDYGTAQWQGGDSNCGHTITHYNDNLKPYVNRPFRGDRRVCIKCGAKRIDAQFGLENTYQEHIQNIVELFRAMKPKLKDSATVWLNYGDSYAATVNGTKCKDMKKNNQFHLKKYGEVKEDRAFRDKPFSTIQGVLKPKDLVMIPNRIAIALQDDGWWIRSEIIWHKPNPMPESTKDRPTSAHEKIWLITKSKKYYYDADAIKVAQKKDSISRAGRDTWKNKIESGNYSIPDSKSAKKLHQKVLDTISKGKIPMANKRNVWTITTKPCKEAHFATFPKDLIEPCIKAGCPEKVCVECGTPYIIIKEKVGKFQRRWSKNNKENSPYEKQGSMQNIYKDKGYEKDCNCKTDKFKSGIVLDPFGGSGTTGIVAQSLNRQSIMIELNPEYIKIAKKRIENELGLFG